METKVMIIAKEKGIKLKKLAECLGIDYSTFWRKANGYSSFSREQLGSLATFLRVSVEDLSNENNRV